VGLDGLRLDDKQRPSPVAHRWESEGAPQPRVAARTVLAHNLSPAAHSHPIPAVAAESEEASLLVAEDDPTPGFECIDKAMLRVRRHVVLMSRRNRAVLCLAVTAAAWLLFSAPSYLFGRRACTHSMPRIFSHRGFDASEALYEVTSQRSLRDLLDGGLHSFDLDLFWTDHDPEGTPHTTRNPCRNPSRNPNSSPRNPSRNPNSSPKPQEPPSRHPPPPHPPPHPEQARCSWATRPLCGGCGTCLQTSCTPH
jgi:hypothetical protein